MRRVTSKKNGGLLRGRMGGGAEVLKIAFLKSILLSFPSANTKYVGIDFFFLKEMNTHVNLEKFINLSHFRYKKT